jgi:cytochrome c oxidase cbb3-type subunit 3
MSNHVKIDEISGTETTGHEWDGIEELNTPMPRWWLWIFYATIVWGIGYMILMPSVPFVQGYFKGVLEHSDRASVYAEIKEENAKRYENMKDLTGASLEDIEADPELLRYALAAGESAFGDNCATCHGSGAQGFKGYPNLNDDVWIWGGQFNDIRRTISLGIRADHEDTRDNLMSAFGRDGMLDKAQINSVAAYVLSLSGKEHEADLVDAGQAIYASNCASCHGSEGLGDMSLGVPNLSDHEWLYGSDKQDIYNSVYYGRAGVMPHWNERLSPEMITALSYYVHSLGGGQPTQEATSE